MNTYLFFASGFILEKGKGEDFGEAFAQSGFVVETDADSKDGTTVSVVALGDVSSCFADEAHGNVGIGIGYVNAKLRFHDTFELFTEVQDIGCGGFVGYSQGTCAKFDSSEIANNDDKCIGQSARLKLAENRTSCGA